MAVSLAQAVRAAAKRGTPLPHIDWLEGLYEGGTEIYRGSLTVFAGTPGARKTMFAVAVVESLNRPALYFSADSDEGVIAPRVLAHRTGQTARDVRHQLNTSDEACSYYESTEFDSPVGYVFDPGPSIGDIYDEVSAWVELHDAYPEVIVVDNLLDVYADFDSEHQGFKAVLKEFKTLARLTGAAVIVTHHHREEDKAVATRPLGRKSMQGRPTQTPALVLSVAVDGYDEFFISVVKDRNGPSHPEADQYITLRSDPERNTFSKTVTLQRRTEEAFGAPVAWSPTDVLERT